MSIDFLLWMGKWRSKANGSSLMSSGCIQLWYNIFSLRCIHFPFVLFAIQQGQVNLLLKMVGIRFVVNMHIMLPRVVDFPCQTVRKTHIEGHVDYSLPPTSKLRMPRMCSLAFETQCEKAALGRQTIGMIGLRSWAGTHCILDGRPSHTSHLPNTARPLWCIVH